jgi:polyisoprenoid-binding protein YceI
MLLLISESAICETLSVGQGKLTGDLTLKGVTRPLEVEVEHVGAETDTWRGYRRGFSGKTKLVLTDFGITKYLGAAAKTVELSFGIEGMHKKSDNRPRRPGGFRKP